MKVMELLHQSKDAAGALWSSIASVAQTSAELWGPLHGTAELERSLLHNTNGHASIHRPARFRGIVRGAVLLSPPHCEAIWRNTPPD